MLSLFLLFLASCLRQYAARDFVALPPSILVGPPPQVTYFSRTFKLECIVSGHPFPTITWCKDGGTLNTNREDTVLEFDNQRLQINLTNDLQKDFHDGNYYCVVENKFGKIISNSTKMVAAVNGQGGGVTLTKTRKVGDAMVLEFVPQVASIPRSSVEWRTRTTNSQTIILDHRIQMSDEGDLHFAFVVKDDERHGGYKAQIFNKPMDTMVGTSYYDVKIENDHLLPHQPMLSFHSPKHVLALEGQNFTLRCFFSGYPAPTVYWAKDDGKIPAGRYFRYTSGLTITNTSKEDAGFYTCSGNSSSGFNSYKIHVQVEAAPRFLSWDNAPFNQNKTDGDEAVFKCLGYGEPQPHRDWIIDGVNLANEPYSHRKVSISGDGSVLTLRNLCKLCDDGHHDMRVVQCKLSNKHGQLLVSGYINILERTRAHITGYPEETLYEQDEKSLSYRCWAKSDPSTEANVVWMRMTSTPKYSVFYGSYYENEEYEQLSNEPPHVEVTGDGRLILQRRKRDPVTWSRIGSRFKCLVYDAYSSDERIVRINIPDSPLAFRRGMISWWWLLVLFVVLLMIIIAVVVCCLKYLKQKGNEYDVDAREQLNGNEPEKELTNHGFTAYKRPDDMVYLKTSKASLGSSGHCSDEDESLNDYGLAEGSKFNEDGSFVGAYVTNPKIVGQMKTKREYISSPFTRYYT